MATKYGQAAIAAWEKAKTVYQTRKKTIFVIIGLIVLYQVVDHYIF